MVFPHDFGFLPRTRGGWRPYRRPPAHGCPSVPGPPRAVASHRRHRGRQLDGKKKIRNDRLIALGTLSHAYKDLKKLQDLPGQFMKELEAFFVNYHNLEGRKYRLLGCRGTKTALDLVKKSQKAARSAK